MDALCTVAKSVSGVGSLRVVARTSSSKTAAPASISVRQLFPRCRLAAKASHVPFSRRGQFTCRAYKVEVEHNGQTVTLDAPDDETILQVALNAGMDLPHDCKLGVCMTCPAKIERGQVDQTEGMLSDDVQEAGYALMCASYPRSDCKIRVIPEEELLSLQLVTSQ